MRIEPRQTYRHPSGRTVSVLAVDEGDRTWVEVVDDAGQRLTMRASTLVERFELVRRESADEVLSALFDVADVARKAEP